MSWEPITDLENDTRSDMSITLEQYDQQDRYGLRNTLRPIKAALDVDESVYDDPCHDSSLPPDARAELEIESYRRKLGMPKKPERRKWHAERTDEDLVETEISHIIRKAGIAPESSTYKLNSKTTSRAAIAVDKYPVAGVEGLYLSPDYFKFENPYVKSPPIPTIEKDKESAKNDASNRGNSYNRGNGISTASGKSLGNSYSRSDGETESRNPFKQSHYGVAGEEYVTPAQLYAMKARRNR